MVNRISVYTIFDNQWLVRSYKSRQLDQSFVPTDLRSPAIVHQVHNVRLR